MGCLPRLDTAYVYTPAIDTSEVVGVLSELQGIGIDTVVLSEVREKSGGCSSATYGWTTGNPDNIGLWLYEANQLGMGIYIGLVFSSGTCSVFHSEPNITQDHDDTDSTVDYIVSTWGGAHPALRGWSIVNEPALAYHTDASILSEHWDYYSEQVAAIRLHSSLPIITAPYLGGVYTAWDGSVQTPAQVAAKAVDFRDNTGVDAQVWQDSLGSELTAFEWSRQPYKVSDYYLALRESLGNSGVWADVELFTYANPQFTGPGYTPTAASQVGYSTLAATGMAQRACFLQPYHMGVAETNHHARSPRLLAAYKAWHGIAGTYVIPSTYTWNTTPQVGQPDTGNQLFDRIVGDPLNASDPSWVGIAANPQVEIDMGQTYDLRWVACEVLHLASASVEFPDSIQVETSSNGIAWTDQGTTNLGFTKSDGKYMLGNASILSASCRYVRVTLANSAVTRISEMELIA